MTRKRNWLGILLLALVLGMIVVGNLNAQTDDRLNGTWVYTTEGLTMETTYNNGNYETSVKGPNFSKFIRGTYTTSNDKIKTQQTHLMDIGDDFIKMGFEPKWYTLNEYISILKKYLIGMGAPESYANEYTSALLSQPEQTYSIVSNSLILTVTVGGQTHTSVYTRK